jgi:hypothetical protein
MVGLIVIAAYPVNSLPARATLLDLLGHALGAGAQGGGAAGAGAPAAETATTAATTGTAAGAVEGPGGGGREGRGEGGWRRSFQEEAGGGLGRAVTVAFCLVSTGIALEVSDLGACPWHEAAGPGVRLRVNEDEYECGRE